jgi:4-amino-4-deoxy-L-arabinose transferase-like glycosyltransferase
VPSNWLASSEESKGDLKKYWHWSALAFLWLFHAVNNWLWLAANATSTGWDRPKQLLYLLTYDGILKHVDARSLFHAVTFNDGKWSYYPPLFHFTALSLQRLLGLSEDVAAMTNVIYMAILLLSVYGIGDRMFGKRAGLLASCLVSLFPMSFSLARYFYLDYALTAAVALSVYLLLLTDGFESKKYSLLFGLSLGLGMLIKWLLVFFLLGPLCVILLRSPVIQDLRRKLARPSLDWRWLGISAMVGLLVTLLWYLPNRDGVTELLLGQWLFLFSWILVAGLVYLVTRQSGPANNFVTASWLGASVASIWYLPRFDFVYHVLGFGYGARSDAPDFSRLSAYTYYPKVLVKEELSWPFTIVLILLVAFMLISGARGRLVEGLSSLRAKALSTAKGQRSNLAQDKVGVNGWILASWLLVPLAVTTLSTHRDARAIMPVLPSLALILAWGLRHCCAGSAIPGRAVRSALLALVLLFGMAQFFVLSYDAFAWVPSRTEIKLPLVGQINLFAEGDHIQWPNSGINDGRYWVMPDVFEHIHAEQGGKTTVPRFGLLINNRQINYRNVEYLLLTRYPDIVLENLDESSGRLPVYPRLFGCDYLAFMQSDQRRVASDQSQEVIKEIIETSPQSFTETFQLVKTYPLPEGEIIYFYRNATGQVPRGFPDELLFPMEHIEQVNLSDKILFLGYDLDPSRVVSDSKVVLTLYWLALEPMEADYVVYLKLINALYHVWGEQESRPYWDGLPTNTWYKGQAIGDPREIKLLPGTPPGSYQITVNLFDPYRQEDLKPERDLVLGPIEVPRREPPPINALDIVHPLVVDLGGKVRLLGYNIESGFRPGDYIHLTLFWQALVEMDQDYTIFTHLTDAKGHLWGQKDNPPVDGFYPTTGWKAEEIVRDQYDILISPDAPPGEYQIEVGMYLVETGERLMVQDESGHYQGNSIFLEPVWVQDGGQG